MKQENVLFAEKNMSLTSTAKLGLAQNLAVLFSATVPVKVKSVKRLEEKETVYNMTVDKNHNYLIGNNIWSRNCDALRYGTENLGRLSIDL